MLFIYGRHKGAQDQRGFSPVTDSLDISVRGQNLAPSAQWQGCANMKEGFDGKNNSTGSIKQQQELQLDWHRQRESSQNLWGHKISHIYIVSKSIHLTWRSCLNLVGPSNELYNEVKLSNQLISGRQQILDLTATHLFFFHTRRWW